MTPGRPKKYKDDYNSRLPKRVAVDDDTNERIKAYCKIYKKPNACELLKLALDRLPQKATN